MADWSFLDILFRGAATLAGRKRRKSESRFETGQDVVAAAIVAGVVVGIAVELFYWMLA